MSEAAERKPLKFASGPRNTLSLAAKAGELAATIRYRDEKDISEGDTLSLRSAHGGDRFGTASVEHVERVPVREALNVVRLHWAEYGIQSIDGLVSTLNDYYDETITLGTEVKVVVLNPTIDTADSRPSRNDSTTSGSGGE